MRENSGPLLSKKLFVQNCSERSSAGGMEGSLALGTRRWGMMGYRKDLVAVPALNGMPGGLLVSVTPVLSQAVSFGLELACFSCHSGCAALVYL